jgi:hypothetical protein
MNNCWCECPSRILTHARHNMNPDQMTQHCQCVNKHHAYTTLRNRLLATIGRYHNKPIIPSSNHRHSTRPNSNFSHGEESNYGRLSWQDVSARVATLPIPGKGHITTQLRKQSLGSLNLWHQEPRGILDTKGGIQHQPAPTPTSVPASQIRSGPRTKTKRCELNRTEQTQQQRAYTVGNGPCKQHVLHLDQCHSKLNDTASCQTLTTHKNIH